VPRFLFGQGASCARRAALVSIRVFNRSEAGCARAATVAYSGRLERDGLDATLPELMRFFIRDLQQRVGIMTL
jgi:hypothetical protein